MKALIIGFFSKTYMPYMERYERIFKEKHIEYDIVTFDRDSTGKNEQIGNTYLFKHTTGTNKLQLLWLSMKYRRLLLKLLRKNHYDKLVILTTMPGILISHKLFKEYKNNYIFDYRDYTYEKIGFYRKIVDKIIGNSFCTLMSSKGYMDYFSHQEKIILTHNLSNEEDCEEKVADLRKKETLNIGFLGYVRYFDVNRKLISAFKNNPRYQFTYIGLPFKDCDLEGFCKENQIENVKFIGRYENSDKAKLYQEIDLINSIYSLDSAEVKPAIPNRLYDAALFKKPIITAKGTYLSEIVEKYELGFALDVEQDDIVQLVENYKKQFDPKEFETKCNIFLKEVYEDEKKCDEYVRKFIDGKKV